MTFSPGLRITGNTQAIHSAKTFPQPEEWAEVNAMREYARQPLRVLSTAVSIEPRALFPNIISSGAEAETSNLLKAWPIIEELYDLRRSQEIHRFLQIHSYLVPLLLEIYEKLTVYFEPLFARPILEVITDPESENDQDLFVLVPTQDSPAEALARLDQLNREWWLDVLHWARGKVTIDIEYR